MDWIFRVASKTIKHFERLLLKIGTIIIRVHLHLIFFSWFLTFRGVVQFFQYILVLFSVLTIAKLHVRVFFCVSTILSYVSAYLCVFSISDADQFLHSRISTYK